MELTAEQQRRALWLHRECVVVDTLGPGGPSVNTQPILDRLDELARRHAAPFEVLAALDEMRHRALVGGELDGFWEAWDDAGVDVTSVTVGAFGPRPFSYDNAIRDLARWTHTFDAVDRLAKITCTADALRAKAENRRGVILNLHNATHIGDDIDGLAFFQSLGIRMIGLTYNSRNLVGDGCTERHPSGLSHFGVDVVRRMNELGILVDVAHCSDTTALDAFEVSGRPVAVSHSFLSSITPHDRGMGDDVLRAVGVHGGFFGVCVVPFFISDGPTPNLEDWLRHIDRAVELAGIGNVGIGTDRGVPLPRQLAYLMNREMRRFGFREEHRVDWDAVTDGFRTWEEWPNLTGALVHHGYSDAEIRGLVGGNFLRVFEQAAG